jgi:uncharacterized membrane protein YqhA
MAILAVLFCTANFAYSKPAMPQEAKALIIKFSLAMAVVFIASVLLTLGLSLYNKFFVKSHIKDIEEKKDSLQSPKDKDEAILSFITKNRLK